MQEYSRLMAEPAIKSFFSKVPWCLSGQLQQKAMLEKTLLMERERFLEESNPIKFSIVSPMWNTKARYLEELIYSCLLQSWPHWELILVDNGSTETDHIEVAEEWVKKDSRIKLIRENSNLGISGGRNRALQEVSGECVSFLDHDDIIHPQIYGAYARMFAQDPELSFVYSNEVKMTDDSTAITDFYSKPEFSLAGLRRTNYFCHLVATRKSFIDRAKLPSGEWFKPKFDGCEDHDFYLRLAVLDNSKFEHLPVFSYFWRVCPGSTASTIEEKPYVYDRATAMLAEHLQEHGLLESSKVETLPTTKFPRQLYSIRFSHSSLQTGAVIIPFRDKPELTLKCLNSLKNQENICNYEVILVDNRSKDEKTREKLDKFLSVNASVFKSIKVINYDGSFNYGKIHNHVVSRETSAEYLLFLNNDVEFKDNQTVTSMFGELEVHKNTGFVGIRLSFADGRMQHGGIKAESQGFNYGLFGTQHILENNGEMPFDEHTVFASSFACIATRREVFEKLGGFEEQFFPNGFGDVEISMRAKSLGYESFYLGTIEAIHHESATRQTADEFLEQVMISRRFGAQLAKSQAHTYSHTEGLDMLGRLDSGAFRLPLRYQMADRINLAAKKFLGPIHKLVKKTVKV